MINTVGSSPSKSRGQSWILFCIAAIVMAALCLKGGFFGTIGEHPLRISFSFPFVMSFSLPAGKFILLFTITWVIFIAMLLLFPRNLSFAKSGLLILAISIICRVALFAHEPSDDINRYLWEGRMINEGINPYQYAPDDPFVSEFAKDDPFHDNINHPSYTAAYPPFIIYLFSLIIRLSYNPFAIKFFMVLFDMGTIFFLLLLLKQRCLDPRWSVLYAFNPLILYSFAGQAHFDVISNFFLVGALYLYGGKRWGWMFLFAGLAVQSKYVAAVTVPFLINRNNLKYIYVMIAAIVIPYLPLIDDRWPMLFASVIKYGEELAFNGSVHGLLRIILGGIDPATGACKILVAASLIFGYIHFHPELKSCYKPEFKSRYKDDPVSGCFFAMGALLIMAPTVHFWYISWVLPFIVLKPRVSWLLLSLTISGYFITNGIYHYTGKWELPVWGYFVQWLPFYILLIKDAYLFRRRGNRPLGQKLPKTVSVVIPTKNEGKKIETCISSVILDSAVCEVIVVDGGSKDNTVELAKKAGGHVINHTKAPHKGGGRGGQIYSGVMAAKGDVVAVVHADTVVTSPTFTNMIKMLEKDRTIAGGAVGGRFDTDKWRFRLIEFANDFRMVFFGISFGDQVQFFRRNPVIEKNLFPNIPLMEDVELSMRMQSLGRQGTLFGQALVSDRRWASVGFQNSFIVICNVVSYLWLRIWKKPDTFAMYKSYYGK